MSMLSLKRRKHPHSGASRHLSPCLGERNPGWLSVAAAGAPFLSPRQGERWRAKRDGVGVLPCALSVSRYSTITHRGVHHG
jgi:hypothetical protein